MPKEARPIPPGTVGAEIQAIYMTEAPLLQCRDKDCDNDTFKVILHRDGDPEYMCTKCGTTRCGKGYCNPIYRAFFESKRQRHC